MATNVVGQAVAALGSVRRGFFFGIRSVPESIIESLLLNVLPGLAGDPMCAVFFRCLLKNRRIFGVIKNKNKCSYEFTENRKKRGS